MNRTATGFALVIAIAATTTAFAHGVGKHLKGSLASVASDHLVVTDTSGKSHDVKLDPKTRYRESSGGAAQASDLRAGDRVVVHFGEKGEASTAVEVRFHHSENMPKAQ
jgi:hypothetical protein